MADVFIERRLSPAAFIEVTSNPKVFADLVDLAAETYSGRRYLRQVRRNLAESQGRHLSRLKLIDEKID